jgi:hypothetical protein
VASPLALLSFVSVSCLNVLSDGDSLAPLFVCEAGAAGKLGTFVAGPIAGDVVIVEIGENVVDPVFVAQQPGCVTAGATVAG